MRPRGTITGQWVVITGLVQSPHFNGRWGYVEDYNAEMQRYVVRVSMEPEVSEFGEGREAGGNGVLAMLRRETLIIPEAGQ